jgi:hypothetical protein
VVQVKVRQQNIDAPQRGRHVHSEAADACACVEHQLGPLFANNLNAGGIAAIAGGLNSGRG